MDYKYITQEVIDEGTINITSGEMNAEAQIYNDRARQLYRKKKLVEHCFRLWYVAQYALLAYCMFYWSIEQETSPLLPLNMLAALAYAILFGYFVLYRKNTKPLTVLLISLPLPLAAWKLIFLLIANVVLAHLYTKFQTELEAEPGYPAFPLLRITYRNEYES